MAAKGERNLGGEAGPVTKINQVLNNHIEIMRRIDRNDKNSSFIGRLRANFIVELDFCKEAGLITEKKYENYLNIIDGIAHRAAFYPH